MKKSNNTTIKRLRSQLDEMENIAQHFEENHKVAAESVEKYREMLKTTRDELTITKEKLEKAVAKKALLIQAVGGLILANSAIHEAATK